MCAHDLARALHALCLLMFERCVSASVFVGFFRGRIEGRVRARPSLVLCWLQGILASQRGGSPSHTEGPTGPHPGPVTRRNNDLSRVPTRHTCGDGGLCDVYLAPLSFRRPLAHMVQSRPVCCWATSSPTAAWLCYPRKLLRLPHSWGDLCHGGGTRGATTMHNITPCGWF